MMAYYLFSQGFRPGGFNRYNDERGLEGWRRATRNGSRRTASGPTPSPTRKSASRASFFDHNLQLNLSAYEMRWNNVQFLFFQPPLHRQHDLRDQRSELQHQGRRTAVRRPPDGWPDLQGSAHLQRQHRSRASPCLIGNIPTSPSFGKCITAINRRRDTTPIPFGAVGGVGGLLAEMAGQYPRPLRLGRS